MRRQHWNRSLGLGALIILTLFFLTACGKSEEEQVLESDNTIGAPPPPPVAIDYPPTPMPTPMVQDYDDDFNDFNQTMGRCRDHMAHKGKLVKFLLALLSGRQAVGLPEGSNEESRGFKPGGRAGGCMGKLGDQMGHLRQWKNKFRPGALQNWIGHSAQWAVDGTQYPSYWNNGNMPDYLGGTGQ